MDWSWERSTVEEGLKCRAQVAYCVQKMGRDPTHLHSCSYKNKGKWREAKVLVAQLFEEECQEWNTQEYQGWEGSHSVPIWPYVFCPHCQLLGLVHSQGLVLELNFVKIGRWPRKDWKGLLTNQCAEKLSPNRHCRGLVHFLSMT